MKKQLLITTILAVLIIWAGTALAIDASKIGKVPIINHTAPANQYQSSPMDSVLVIKGKINMGNTDYYSVMPVIGGDFIMIDGKPLDDTVLQELGIYKADFVPQFKSSASSGWTIYLCAMTGPNPSYWDKFQAIGNVTVTSIGMVQVKYQQNGNDEPLIATPGQGMQITKPVGPVQPK